MVWPEIPWEAVTAKQSCYMTLQAENIDNKHATDHFIFDSFFVVYDSNT